MRIILSLLFSLVIVFPGWAQALNYEVAEDNEQHAMIWHRALAWVYSDNNKSVPVAQQKKMPEVSESNLKKFETDLKNASVKGKDGYNFYQLLYLPVASRLYKRPNELVDANLLIRQIVKEAAAKPGRDTVKLKEALTAFVARTRPKPDVVAKADSAGIAPPVTTRTAPPVIPAEPGQYAVNKSLPFDFDLPMGLSLIAFALAAWALFRTFGRKSQAVAATARNYSTSTGTEVGTATGSKQINGIVNEVKSLREEMNRLKKENERLLNLMAGEIQEVRNAVSAKQMNSQKSYQNQAHNSTQFQEPTQQQPAPQNQIQDLSQPPGYAQPAFEIDDDHLIMGTENPEPIVAGSFTKYARVPEDSVIKDRDMHADRNDNWSFIEISVSDPNAQTARFRINPHINHALAINNSLDRLENAFDFPRTANKASTIVNQIDGELVRVPQGWKIEKRAKITLQ